MAVFNAYEVFEMAEQIERNGGAFYRRGAEIVQDMDSKDFLLKLASMEDEHETYFDTLKNKFNLESGNELPDLDEQYKNYLCALIDGKIFDLTGAVDKISPGDSMQDILQMALCFERTTVVYFASIKDLVPDELGKNKIDSLIQEEIRHIAILTEKLNELN
jgi:rubrerythrin